MQVQCGLNSPVIVPNTTYRKRNVVVTKKAISTLLFGKKGKYVYNDIMITIVAVIEPITITIKWITLKKSFNDFFLLLLLSHTRLS
jgi:hypothetical protein